MRDLSTIFESSDLRITHQAASENSAEAVVCFTGVRHGFGGLRTEEFRRSLQRLAVTRDLYFVADLKRRWYNGLADTVLEALNPHVAGRSVCTLGNSMGGFGALIFGALMPTCRTRIAFVPQFSVRPGDVPLEDRWREFTTPIVEWTIPNCCPSPLAGSNLKTFLFCGDEDVRDLRHVELIARNTTVTAGFVMRSMDHNVAVSLRDRGVLENVLLHLIEPSVADPAKISAQLEEVGMGFDILT